MIVLTTDWNAEASMDEFQEAFEDFGDKLMPLVAVAEKPRVWQLRRLPTLPTWTKGNVALLGDAAHAMFPSRLCLPFPRLFAI
jgi:salicylate hydroxylase